ncbi:hypothetical protein SCHPADRAFT_558271 [Schizopora paradoxa]|uniref:Uncharacterized protein n=1 Tax=Schizopora paradoxa TaxID=27342 RepID=A0A0H2RXV7_9AGAM|nr:hypothetical protein SCHPADRAFT_558271 [Schizopora paradoxa]
MLQLYHVRNENCSRRSPHSDGILYSIFRVFFGRKVRRKQSALCCTASVASGFLSMNHDPGESIEADNVSMKRQE